MRILFTTVALPGHFFPLVSLAWAFRSDGHEVLVATSENFLETVLRSGLPAESYGPATDFVDLLPSPLSAGDRLHAHGRAFGHLAARRLIGTTSLVEAWRPDLVVSERAEFSGPLAATAHGVPWVEYQWGVAALDEHRRSATGELRAELADAGLDALPEPAMVLNPWPPSLRLEHAKDHQNLRYVPYNGDAEVPDWAMGERALPRICLTVGTLLPRLGPGAVADFVIPTLEKLAGMDVELVVAVDNAVADAWPADLPDAVLAVGRMPLAEILQACDVLVNHGGQGSALTALVAGCPQLLLPQFDDQFDNADAVVKAGAGLRLAPEDITPEGVAAGCRELLHDARYRRSSTAIAREIAAQPSPSEIVALLDSRFGNGAGPPHGTGAPTTGASSR